MAPLLVIVKLGTSSLTDERGIIAEANLAKVVDEVCSLRAAGHRVVLVSSGAIAAGLPSLGMADVRPTDLATLQAASAVGQPLLMRVWNDLFSAQGVVPGQVLLAPLDFVHRQQYLHARQTMGRLLELGVVPIVNENDAIADDEIRFGDNDRLAALVGHMIAADLLVLLTDTAGLFTADPRVDGQASLIEEIVATDHALVGMAVDVSRPGSERGSGGMASKLAAARMAAWSGVRAVIAAADRPGVLAAAVAGEGGVGTTFRPHDRRLPARKLWIAFAIGSSGTVVVDHGARLALTERGTSLLPAGVVGVQGDFDEEDAVEVADTDGRVFAKGLVRHGSETVRAIAGRRSGDLPPDLVPEVIHRDDLVVLP